MTGTIRNLGKAARHDMIVTVSCRTCRREAMFRAFDLMTLLGPNREIESLRFRCRDCGSRAHRVSVGEAFGPAPRSAVLWYPSRL